MPTMSHSDSCGGTYWKTSFTPAMWLKSPETPKERKVSRNIRAQSNSINESLLSIAYQKTLGEGGKVGSAGTLK